jgi:hypothetical protein
LQSRKEVQKFAYTSKDNFNKDIKMNSAQPEGETLYVEPGTRKSNIYAAPYKLKPGLSPEALARKQMDDRWKLVGQLEGGRITALEKDYWATADETLLTGGMLLEVKKIPATTGQAV